MTPKEAELLRDLEIAATVIVRLRWSSGATTWADFLDAIRISEAALKALAAYRAQPQEAEREMVTLGLMRSLIDGKLAAGSDPGQEDPRYWQHIGNIVFQMPPAVALPTIPAKVET